MHHACMYDFGPCGSRDSNPDGMALFAFETPASAAALLALRASWKINLTCRNCNGIGHVATECPIPNRQGGGEGSSGACCMELAPDAMVRQIC